MRRYVRQQCNLGSPLPHRHIHHDLARDRFQCGLHLGRFQPGRQAQVGVHVEERRSGVGFGREPCLERLDVGAERVADAGHHGVLALARFLASETTILQADPGPDPDISMLETEAPPPWSGGGGRYAIPSQDDCRNCHAGARSTVLP